jgi:hypothetical protein
VQEESLQQMVSFSTHIERNILDLLTTNCPGLVLSTSGEERLGRRKHCIIFNFIECSVQRKSTKTSPNNGSSSDYQGIRDSLGMVDWEMELRAY